MRSEITPSTIPDPRRTLPAATGRWTRWLTLPIYLGCLAAFLTDITQDLYINFGLFYVPLVCTAVLYRNRRSVWFLAGLSSALVTLGFFFPYLAASPLNSFINRSMSVVAILITAALVWHARIVQDLLAEQTKRAEAAERLKTEVFTTLSEEMRNPLHGLVGLTEVMMTNCRPDQRVPLTQVQGSGKRLLATIENLIDLTHLDERPIRSESVDINALIRQAAERSRPSAAEKQIAVEVETDDGPIITNRADPWAVRRILDNLLANALKFSPAGGVVELAAESQPGAVALIVRDTGIGMSPDVLRNLGEPFFQAAEDGNPPMSGTGTGLALSRRLASAMGGELVFDSEPGCGTTATLRLRA